jgi:hypothetical protein
MCYDLSHDRDLGNRLLEEAARSSSSFEVIGCSEGNEISDAWSERMRKRIRAAHEVIVICGAHTHHSLQVAAEIGIAQAEHKPYFLLWGRRDVMCTKPAGARPTDGMYRWTTDTISDQIALTLRLAQSLEVPSRLKRPGIRAPA